MLNEDRQFRFINGVYTHLRAPRSSSRSRITPADIGPRALFQPIIISTHTPLLECDINAHKSNSTFFSDLDISRTHLLSCLLQRGMMKARETEGVSHWAFKFILGSVCSVFRREIKPYERFEIWSRVLSWDRKWLYVISHLVQKDGARPKEYLLQPEGPRRWRWLLLLTDPISSWRRSRSHQKPKQERAQVIVDGPNAGPAPAASTAHPAIYASAISKYVVKRGRRTIPPEQVLENAGLLPPRPAAPDPEPPSSSAPASSSSSSASPAQYPAIVPGPASTSEDNGDGLLQASLLPGSASPDHSTGTETTGEPSADPWDWARVEAERQRGMELASLVADLDASHGAFTGGDGTALGEYNDLF